MDSPAERRLFAAVGNIGTAQTNVHKYPTLQAESLRLLVAQMAR